MSISVAGWQFLVDVYAQLYLLLYLPAYTSPHNSFCIVCRYEFDLLILQEN